MWQYAPSVYYYNTNYTRMSSNMNAVHSVAVV
jgi:hypothetical protein